MRRARPNRRSACLRFDGRCLAAVDDVLGCDPDPVGDPIVPADGGAVTSEQKLCTTEVQVDLYSDPMEWIFEGIGTMLIGLVIGAGAGSAVTWQIAVKKSSQRQSARDNAKQIQAGRDVKKVK